MVKRVVALCLSLIVTIFGVTTNPCRAESHDSVPTFSASSKHYNVNDFQDLLRAVSFAEKGETIILESDICVSSTLNLKKSICLDLNGHSILFESNSDARIVVGEKKFDHTEKHTVWHPGYYSYDTTDETTYRHNSPGQPAERTEKHKRVWHEGHSETLYKDVYRYADDVCVTITNGKIKKSSGTCGCDGIENTWFKYNGSDGETPDAPIEVLSGAINLKDMTVRGGNGGDGGDGSYQKLWHIIFGGGSGGNGGNGGDGGCAIQIDRKECVVSYNYDTSLRAGKPGKGGQAGDVNRNYWLYRGWRGHDGKNGRDNPAIIYM